MQDSQQPQSGADGMRHWDDVLSGMAPSLVLGRRAVRHSRWVADMAKMANLRFGVVGGALLAVASVQEEVARASQAGGAEVLLAPIIIKFLAWIMFVTWRIHALHERGEDAVCEEILQSKRAPETYSERIQQARELSVIRHLRLHWAMAWGVLLSDVAMLLMSVGTLRGVLIVPQVAPVALILLVASVLVPDITFVVMSMQGERTKPVPEFLRSPRLVAPLVVVALVAASLTVA